MKTLVAVLCIAGLSVPGRVGRAETPGPSDGLAALDALIGGQRAHPASAAALTLDEIEHMALAENPEIHVAARRVAMAEAHVPTASALDDPELMYRGWGVPLRQPWNYNSAQNMLMVSQMLPSPGKRDLRTNVAESDVGQAKDELENARLHVRVEVRKAFYDMLRAQDELVIHDEHVAIAHQAIEAARIRYAVGKVPQQDILKAQLALTRLAEHMIRFDRDVEIARDHLNTLLGRDPARPIEVRGELSVSTVLPSVESLEKMALETRPDLREAQTAIDKSRKEQELAKKAYVPDFTVSAGYMLMPSGTDPRNDYMVEGSMNLPWLNRRKHEAEIAESTAKVTEQDAELAAMRNEAFGQIQEALAEARAAQQLARVYQDSLQPQAEATLHAAVIAYENNQTEFLDLLDSQMTVVDLGLAGIEATADFDARLADLELAVGAPIDAPVPTEVKP